MFWTPAFAGVTTQETSYETIITEAVFKFSCKSRPDKKIFGRIYAMNRDDRRLIEDYLPIKAISAEASREKSVRN
jgi:hypothetical protein